jgi:hypothetical protein
VNDYGGILPSVGGKKSIKPSFQRALSGFGQIHHTRVEVDDEKASDGDNQSNRAIAVQLITHEIDALEAEIRTDPGMVPTGLCGCCE